MTGKGAKVPVLVISGSMGAGKTTVLGDAHDLLKEAGVPHAAIDLDWLSIMFPSDGQHGEQLMFANLAAVWRNYSASGAERLLIARGVEDRSELELYREAIPGAELIVCRLTAPVVTMQERVRVREPGMIQEHAVGRAAELDNILERTRAEDFTVDNGEGRSITDVAREMLSSAGWL